jgi:hypothetical protein
MILLRQKHYRGQAMPSKIVIMKSGLMEDLRRFEKMAFQRAADCTEAIRRFYRLSKKAREGEDFELLKKAYEWVFVPMSIWPVDVRGLCLYLLDCVARGRRVDERARLLCEYLGDAPGREVRAQVAEYEHAVKAGSYESLIEAQYKFDLMETELEENAEFKADWERLKAEFAVEKYRNAKGVVRRRMVQERNFRPRDWKFGWKTEAERFQNVFDAFCHRWDLYGMEKDRPLLLKLSVNLTPFSTMIEVPRYWSFDPKRDLKWGAVTKLHRMREVRRQGPKLSPSRAARHTEAELARRLWREATRAGLKGDGRKEWVMERLGWDARTDASRLRRLMKEK